MLAENVIQKKDAKPSGYILPPTVGMAWSGRFQKKRSAVSGRMKMMKATRAFN
jgi:hypothetical protein